MQIIFHDLRDDCRKEGESIEAERMTEGRRSGDNGWEADDQWAWSLMEKKERRGGIRTHQ